MKTKAKLLPASLGEGKKEQSSVSTQESFQGKERNTWLLQKGRKEVFSTSGPAARYEGSNLVLLYMENETIAWLKQLLTTFEKYSSHFYVHESLHISHLMRKTFNKKK